MSNIVAPGFVPARSLRMVDPVSIYDLKSTETAEHLATSLSRGKVVPLARTKSSGEVIETLCFAVPADFVAGKAPKSSTAFSWRTLRRNPREAAETARLLQRALEIEGLQDDDGNDVSFFVVPDDTRPRFSDLEEDEDAAKVAALRRIADGIEELNRLLTGRLGVAA
jgi:hypothetical protein